MQTRQGLASYSGYSQDGNRVILEFRAGRLAITALEEGFWRVRYSRQAEFAPRRSWAVTKADSEFAGLSLTVSEEAEIIELSAGQMRLRVNRVEAGVEWRTAVGQVLLQDIQGPQWLADGSFVSYKKMPADEFYYGFGERTGLLNKRGKRYTCWNTDPVDRNMDHGPGANELYQSHPFFMALRPTVGGYGLFLNNTFKTTFDVGHKDPARLSIEGAGGELDYFLIYGPDPATIVQKYTDLTGRMPLPPRWALGYHQCRWSYYPEAKVREIAHELRARKIPADVIHLDIDYMDGFRVFTWDKDRFPDPAKLIGDLGEQGFKVVNIIDPGVKYDPNNGYRVYDEGAEKDYFVRQAGGELFHGYVWPDDSVFADFARAEVREWWGDLHKELLAAGVRGIWNDMNEPAISSTPFEEWGPHIDITLDAPQGSPAELTSHAEIHNLYGLLEDQATYEGWRRLQPDTRPFLLTRAGYAGVQRYSAVWTGDNDAYWEHLEMSMPQLANLGLSGISFAGADIGGFGGTSTPELWARWIQLGAFYPFSRGHAATWTPPKEPWAFGERTESIARRYIELRYRLLPYLYTLFEESSRTGAPILRPLLYQFYQDANTLQLHDQLMLGSALMVAPIYLPGQEYRHVYLPKGQWYNFWNNALQEGSDLLAHAPLEDLPLYVHGGTILPLGPVMQYSDERPLDQLSLEIYLDEHGVARGRLYEDDGISFRYQGGDSCTTLYTAATDAAGKVRVTANRQGQYVPAPRTIEIRVHGLVGTKHTSLAEDKGDWEVSF